MAAKKIIKNVFGDIVSDFTMNILEYIIDKERFSYIKPIVKEYLKIYYLKITKNF